MTRTTGQQDQLVQSGSRQLLIGIALLVVGAGLATWLVLKEATVGAGVGFAVAIAGLVMIGSALRVRARGQG